MIKQPLAAFTATSFAAVIVWTAPAAAQDAAQNSVCGKPSFADRVALNPVPGSNLMTVPLAFNGAAKQFLLDIGTAPDEISEAAVKDLHLPKVDLRAGDNSTIANNSAFRFEVPIIDANRARASGTTQPQVSAEAVTLGDVTLPGLKFLVSTDRDLGKSKPYDGRLTASGFRRYDLDVDFGAKRLAFLAPTNCADPHGIVYWPHTVVAVIPMTSAFGKIAVPVTIEGHQIDAVIDTGSDRTVMRRAVAERLFGLKADTPEMMPEADLRDGTGARVYRHTFSQIALEGVSADNVPVLIEANSMISKARTAAVTGSRLQADNDPGDPIPDLALGMDMLRQLHIYAAFGQSKLYVTPANGPAIDAR